MAKAKKIVDLDKLAFKSSRKKNCRLIIKINSLITVIWALINIGIIYFIVDRMDEIERFTEEAHLLRGSGILAFQQCKFQHDYFSTPFDMTRCSDQCGSKAIAWRTRNLAQPFTKYVVEEKDIEKGLHHMCLDYLDHVYCHDDHRECQRPRREFKECAGLTGTGVEGQISYGYPVYAPAINDADMQHLRGKTLLANELIVKCPICRIQSDWFKVDGTYGYYKHRPQLRCIAKLATVAIGWPRFAEFCDNTVKAIKPFDDCVHFSNQVDIIAN
ncbi:unnamed protein product [Bursaphelenchus xylophilus]|uniref:(pine wood nematode) hypothetical protein n=1 Tax=Bursaphelenchus xylophilus TaxID=6326 RepID=A0A1I7SEA8_BURXY|nr:unnamed protein product [Bursaphelenchus xylophilus]CAG9087401.1 unnamed protein product [Bursaphelenchus xylophilus]